VASNARAPVDHQAVGGIGNNVFMALASSRAWWIRTIIVNFLGIAILLVGWAVDSKAILIIGFLVLGLSLGVRIAILLVGQTKQR